MSAERPSSLGASRYALAARNASSAPRDGAGRVGKERIFAVSGIRATEFDQLQAARKVMSNISRLSRKQELQLLVRITNAGADQILLILACELTTRNK